MLAFLLLELYDCAENTILAEKITGSYDESICTSQVLRITFPTEPGKIGTTLSIDHIIMQASIPSSLIITSTQHLIDRSTL